MTTFFDLSGKTAIVTGAGSGIGQAIAVRFAQAGAYVAVWDIHEQAALETVGMIRAAGGQAETVVVDVAADAMVEAAVASLEMRRGHIAIFVNNAGVASVGNVAETSAAELERVYKVNIAGVANGLRAIAPRMAKHGGGAILNLASIASLVGIKDRFAYSASKGAVLTMTYSVAIDYAQQGVRCNCICPARVHTPFVDGYLEKNYPNSKKEMFEKLSTYQPIGRMGQPEEIAALAHFLCSDEAAFITGAAYPIDGGVCSMPGFEA